jgi:uncharacterized membrane protein YbaN (DUF454 family)
MTAKDRPTRASTPLRRILLTTAGFISLALGVAGIFLPVLPTTPFLLIAAACFVRSSERLYRWLLGHPWFGTYIRVYRQYHAITLSTKITSLTFLWLTIGYSVLYVIDALPLRLLLLAIAIGVTVHLVRLKNLTREMLAPVAAPEAPRQPACDVSEGLS